MMLSPKRLNLHVSSNEEYIKDVSDEELNNIVEKEMESFEKQKGRRKKKDKKN